MKNLFRLSVFALLVGGWALAAASLHVIRTPSSFIVIPKDQIGYRDTYVDTRAWTLADDSAHPAVVSRLIHLGKTDALSHTVNSNSGPLDAQLTVAMQHPSATVDTSTIADKAKSGWKNVADTVKSKLN